MRRSRSMRSATVFKVSMFITSPCVGCESERNEEPMDDAELMWLRRLAWYAGRAVSGYLTWQTVIQAWNDGEPEWRDSVIRQESDPAWPGMRSADDG